MSSLYEIDKNIEQVIELGFAFDEETGEVLFDESSLDELNQMRDTKIENIGLYIKNLEADSDAFDKEIKSFQQRKKRADAKIKRMKEYLNQHLDERFETTRLSVSFRNSESVRILDLDSIPERFLTEKREYVPNKQEIKKALKNGDRLVGAVLEKNRNVTIK